MLRNIKNFFPSKTSSSTQSSLKNGRTVLVKIYGSRKNDVFLCIGGLGTPNELFSPLAKILQDHLCLISYEYQWSNGQYSSTENIDGYVDDINEILQQLNISTFSCIAFCMGAKKLLRLLEKRERSLNQIILINPNLTDKHQTFEYSRLSQVFQYVANNPDSKDQTFEMMRTTIKSDGEDRFKQLLATPYNTNSSVFYNFSTYSNTLVSESIDNKISLFISRDSTILWDTDSELSDPRNCQELFSACQHANQIYGAYGGHYSIYYNPEFLKLIIASIESTRSNQTTKV